MLMRAMVLFFLFFARVAQALLPVRFRREPTAQALATPIKRRAAGIEPATFPASRDDLPTEVTRVFTTGEDFRRGFRALLPRDPSVPLPAPIPRAGPETRPSFLQIPKLRQIPSPRLPTLLPKPSANFPPSLC